MDTYSIYRSEFIKVHRHVLRSTAETCLKKETLHRFWADAIKSINKDSHCDEDGKIYTSEDMEVYLGPWDIKIKHHYKWIEKLGGDSFMGHWEEYAELDEGFEVVSARDEDYNENLPGLVGVLNAFYRENKSKLF